MTDYEKVVLPLFGRPCEKANAFSFVAGGQFNSNSLPELELLAKRPWRPRPGSRLLGPQKEGLKTFPWEFRVQGGQSRPSRSQRNRRVSGCMAHKCRMCCFSENDLCVCVNTVCVWEISPCRQCFAPRVQHGQRIHPKWGLHWIQLISIYGAFHVLESCSNTSPLPFQLLVFLQVPFQPATYGFARKFGPSLFRRLRGPTGTAPGRPAYLFQRITPGESGAPGQWQGQDVQEALGVCFPAWGGGQASRRHFMVFTFENIANRRFSIF